MGRLLHLLLIAHVSVYAQLSIYIFPILFFDLFSNTEQRISELINCDLFFWPIFSLLFPSISFNFVFRSFLFFSLAQIALCKEIDSKSDLLQEESYVIPAEHRTV